LLPLILPAFGEGDHALRMVEGYSTTDEDFDGAGDNPSTAKWRSPSPKAGRIK